MNRLGSTIARLKLKGIDGDLHKQWIMWFNSMVTEEPHQGLKPKCKLPETGALARLLGRCCMAVVSSWFELFP